MACGTRVAAAAACGLHLSPPLCCHSQARWATTAIGRLATGESINWPGCCWAVQRGRGISSGVPGSHLTRPCCSCLVPAAATVSAPPTGALEIGEKQTDHLRGACCCRLCAMHIGACCSPRRHCPTLPCSAACSRPVPGGAPTCGKVCPGLRLCLWRGPAVRRGCACWSPCSSQRVPCLPPRAAVQVGLGRAGQQLCLVHHQHRLRRQ